MPTINDFFFTIDKPSSPRHLRVIDQYKDFITIAWDPPKHDGGAAISGYIIEKCDASRKMWMQAAEIGAESNKFKVTKLIEGNEYMFRVAAKNSVGTGSFGTMEESVQATLPFGEFSLNPTIV